MTTEINLAPHLERVLDAMSKDLAIDRQALVNQAVFAWLRINGYVAAGAQQAQPPAGASAVSVAKNVAEPVPVVAAVAPVAPIAAPAAPAPVTGQMPVHVPGSSPSVVAQSAQRIEAPPEPGAPQAPAVSAPPSSAPSGGQLAALARMKEIAADLEKLTRPWPDWVAQEEHDEEEEDDDAEDEEAQEQEEDEDDAEEASGPEDEPVSQPESRDPFEAELPEEVNTGESELEQRAQGEEREAAQEEEDAPAPPPEDDAVGESTVVLRSVPIVLYLEREGLEPIRVETERFIIGRGPQCDLVIDSPRVSREHAVLTRQGIRYFIEDLNSSNGTWFGEERVSQKEIESGDVISLGNEPVTFILRGE
jgi:hypothetical protein